MSAKRIAAAVIGAEVGMAALLTLGVAHSHGIAYAEPSVPIIELSDVPDIDSLPVCAEEDCSDQPGQTGVWLDRDTGNWYLERGEGQTWLIVDATIDHGLLNGGLPGPVMLMP